MIRLGMGLELLMVDKKKASLFHISLVGLAMGMRNFERVQRGQHRMMAWQHMMRQSMMKQRVQSMMKKQVQSMMNLNRMMIPSCNCILELTQRSLG
ncbi:CLUMA_CG021077, isoform A [Clunio marinus]|uniref:CLUMA_CG021077, isoform A n=1 Tax=Clunio marinus TaxID=568069 RepID=A0A1J1J794_9DIPT|nr:CLUMA_CG021077, isoform A [Clunio marinus]